MLQKKWLKSVAASKPCGAKKKLSVPSHPDFRKNQRFQWQYQRGATSALETSRQLKRMLKCLT